jgi:hypothetical protein
MVKKAKLSAEAGVLNSWFRNISLGETENSVISGHQAYSVVDFVQFISE